MIEPTETEARETFDPFIEAMKEIALEIATDPEKVKTAPHTLPVRRPNDVLAPHVNLSFPIAIKSGKKCCWRTESGDPDAGPVFSECGGSVRISHP